jgi:DNA-binding GntR family transcriptional regulator
MASESDLPEHPRPSADDGSVRARILKSLRLAIAEGRLRPGEKLSEERLARDFGVSRTPVREALKQLHNESLVEIRRRSGTFVAQLSKADLPELLALREILEGLSARLCATADPARWRPAVLAAISDMEFAAARDDASAYFLADRKFHQAILHGGADGPVVDHYDRVFNRLNLYALSVMAQQRRVKQGLAEHKAIVSALEAGDADAAEKAMRRHARNGQAAVLAQQELLPDGPVVAFPPALDLV